MSLVDAISYLYGATGAAMLAAYVPQVLAAARSRDGARDVSLATWASWTFAALVSSAYAGLVVRDLGFLLMACGNLIGCASVLGAVLWSRRAGARAIVAITPA